MTMRRTAIFILVVVACAWIVSQWPIGDDEARPVNALSAAAVAPPQSTEVIGTGIAEVQRQALAVTERCVCGLLLKGLSPKAISEARGVSLETVRRQVKSLYFKTGCRNHAE